MKSRTASAFLAASLAATSLLAQGQKPQAFSDDVRQAYKGAAEKIEASVKASKIKPDQAVAFFFLSGDADGYVESLVRDAFVAAGRTVVVPNDDENAFIKKIYAEMEFDERKAGVVDAKTVDAINAGQLKSTQVLLYGNVWTVVDDDSSVLVEISLGAFSVQTKEYLWSGSFDCRRYKPKAGETMPRIGLVDLPPEVRETLKRDIEGKIEKSIAAQPRIKAVKSAAIIPLVGDEVAAVRDSTGRSRLAASGDGAVILDGYVTHIVVDAVTRTSIVPKNAGIRTRADAIRIARDKPPFADALVGGAVRAIGVYVDGYAFRKINYSVDIDVQLSIETADGHDVLWSDTVQTRAKYAKELTWWEWFFNDYPEINHARFYVRLAAWILGALVALVVFFRIVSAATRVR